MTWLEGMNIDGMDPLQQFALDNKLRDAILHGEEPFVIRQLIDDGARVNPESEHDDVNMQPEPLLHLAARLNRPTVLEMLIGADWEKRNVHDMYGRNALHVAALEGSDDATYVLLQAGLNPLEKDRLDFTAVDLAQARGNMDIIETIRSAFADEEIILREDVDNLRAAVAVAYPQTVQSHVKQVRQRRDAPPPLDLPIR